ncbi:MAG TPA: hypothetical protein VMR98_01115, partial [Candidatus Polarisedimenticolaceae bacterium]|nr:hypothetical protein [Candidatus Polarisedimenticolaceae bacterium]
FAVSLVLFLSRLTPESSYLTGILPAMLLMPIGVGMTFMPVIAAATSGVAAEDSGLASGLINTSQQMGGALGLAALSGVAALVTAAAAFHSTPVEALVHGYDRAFLVGVVFMVAASIVAAVVIKQHPNPKSIGSTQIQL